jgi:hypothetical protein
VLVLSNVKLLAVSVFLREFQYTTLKGRIPKSVPISCGEDKIIYVYVIAVILSIGDRECMVGKFKIRLAEKDLLELPGIWRIAVKGLGIVIQSDGKEPVVRPLRAKEVTSSAIKVKRSIGTLSRKTARQNTLVC